MTATIAHWEVTRAKNAGQKPNPHGGQFDKWYLSLKNLDGGDDCEDAYWQRKSPSEVTVGDKIYGKVEEGDYGDRFYLEKDEGGFSGGSTERSTGSSGRNIDASIARQVALKIVAPLIIEEKGLHRTTKEIVGEIETFILEAGQEAPIDFSGARKAEPVQELADTFGGSVQDDYGQLLDSAGLSFAPARDKVAEYMQTLPKERLNKALSGLQDLDRQQAVLGQLKTETERASGPLPQGDALDGSDEVPF